MIKKVLFVVSVILILSVALIFPISALSVDDAIVPNWTALGAGYQRLHYILYAPEMNDYQIITDGFNYEIDEELGIHMSIRRTNGSFVVASLSSKNATALDGLDVTMDVSKINLGLDEDDHSSAVSVMFSSMPVERIAGGYDPDTHLYTEGIVDARQHLGIGLGDMLPEGASYMEVYISNDNLESTDKKVATGVTVTYGDGVNRFSWRFTRRDGDADMSGITQEYEAISFNGELAVSFRSDEELGFIVSVNGVDYCRGEDVAYFPACSTATFNNTENNWYELDSADYVNRSDRYLDSMTYAAQDIDLSGFIGGESGYLTVSGMSNRTLGNMGQYTLKTVNGVPAAIWPEDHRCKHINTKPGAVTVTANCTTKGECELLCADCGEYLGVTETDINPNAHSTQWVTTRAATCEAEGEKQNQCIRGCGYVAQTQSIPKAYHRYKTEILAEATCYSKGAEKLTCENCGYIRYDEIPMDTHVFYGFITYQPATCISNEFTIAYCYYGCGEYEIEEVEGSKTDHSGEWYVTAYPTCTSDGKQRFECAYCDYVLEQNTGKGPHQYSRQVLVLPTKSSDGMMKYTCTYCSHTYNDVIALDDIMASDVFKDVKESAWYSEAITYCFRNGYVSGVSQDRFDPSGKLTRAQFVMLLAKVDGVDLSQYKNKSNGFSDVKTGQWYYTAVTWAATNGFASGTGSGKFSPNADVTREQLARFFYVYAEKKGRDVSKKADLSSFTDASKVSSWALDPIKWAVANNIINGTSATTLSPRSTATRAQASQMISVFSNVVKYKDVYDAMVDYVKKNGRGDISQYYYVISEKNAYSSATYYRKEQNLVLERISDKGGVYYEFKLKMDAVTGEYEYTYYYDGSEEVYVSGIMSAEGFTMSSLDDLFSESYCLSMINKAYDELKVFIDKILEGTVYTNTDLFK